MQITKTTKNIFFIWLGWVVVLLGFQSLVTARLGIQLPDFAVSWSENETLPDSNQDKIYLLEPFMNAQVAWDSEYYVGIAVGGYDDPKAGAVRNPATGQMVIKNYSFFPLYPFLMSGIKHAFLVFDLNEIGAASLAGVVISVLGALAGMFALWDLTKDYFDGEARYRTLFYMLIFPTGFFFAMVYTEGLFIGLAFWVLALSKRKKWLWATLLSVPAVLTRAHGAALALPLGIAWLMAGFKDKKIGDAVFDWKWWVQGVLVLFPLAAYWFWRTSPLGEGWAELQSFYFGRGLMSWERSVFSWKQAFEYAWYMELQGKIYFIIEVCSILIALAGSIWLMRKDIMVAAFSLAVVVLSVLSGVPQSMARYMVIAPAMFIFLASLGKNKAFDRVWSIVSILLLGMEVMLFTFDMWVG